MGIKILYKLVIHFSLFIIFLYPGLQLIDIKEVVNGTDIPANLKPSLINDLNQYFENYKNKQFNEVDKLLMHSGRTLILPLTEEEVEFYNNLDVTLIDFEPDMILISSRELHWQIGEQTRTLRGCARYFYNWLPLESEVYIRIRYENQKWKFSELFLAPPGREIPCRNLNLKNK